MRESEQAPSEFEKHVDKCKQCNDNYLSPENYCEEGSTLYCKAADESQKDFDEQVRNHGTQKH